MLGNPHQSGNPHQVWNPPQVKTNIRVGTHIKFVKPVQVKTNLERKFQIKNNITSHIIYQTVTQNYQKLQIISYL